MSDFEYIDEALELYEELVQDLINSFGPKNQHEESLITLMATALWKLCRFDNYEASLWNDKIERHYSLIQDESDDQHIKITNLGKMESALKYKQSMEAQYYRAFAALIEGRKANRELDLFLNFGENHVQTEKQSAREIETDL